MIPISRALAQQRLVNTMLLTMCYTPSLNLSFFNFFHIIPILLIFLIFLLFLFFYPINIQSSHTSIIFAQCTVTWLYRC